MHHSDSLKTKEFTLKGPSYEIVALFQCGKNSSERSFFYLQSPLLAPTFL